MQFSSRVNSVIRLLLIGALVFVAMPQVQAMEPALWEKLQTGEAVAIMRHAIAPGNGDPDHFSLEDCATQRNLSQQGQLQALRVGELLKSNGIAEAAVYSSQWCRCVDTANGLNFGAVQGLPVLNSFYQDRSTENQQTATLLSWLKERVANIGSATIKPTVLVSHQVNITSLTGVYPGSGEIVLVGFQDGVLSVLGTVKTQ